MTSSVYNTASLSEAHVLIGFFADVSLFIGTFSLQFISSKKCNSYFSSPKIKKKRLNCSSGNEEYHSCELPNFELSFLLLSTYENCEFKRTGVKSAG